MEVDGPSRLSKRERQVRDTIRRRHRRDPFCELKFKAYQGTFLRRKASSIIRVQLPQEVDGCKIFATFDTKEDASQIRDVHDDEAKASEASSMTRNFDTTHNTTNNNNEADEDDGVDGVDGDYNEDDETASNETGSNETATAQVPRERRRAKEQRNDRREEQRIHKQRNE
jgi:hypothetical protein